MATIFYDALLKCLPNELKSHTVCLAYDDASRVILDSVLRFALLGEQSADDAAKSMTCPRVDWVYAQEGWRPKRNDLLASAPIIGQKRPRDNESTWANWANGQGAESEGSSKKAKVEFPDNQPLYTLHGISCAWPMRKNLDINIGTTAISLNAPGAQDTLSATAVSDLKYGFLLPTPGKAKPYFTMVLLGEKTEGKSKDDNQIIFGLNATTTAAFKTTSYSPAAVTTNHPKNTPVLDHLLEFSSHLPSHFAFFDASRSSFRSAIDKEECGATAYLRAKEGHMYFFKEGILWGEKKPCLWFPLSAIHSVKIWSATGKTATLHIDQVDPDSSEDGGDTVEFGMIDGREMPGIRDWIRDAEPRFGSAAVTGVTPLADVKGKGKARADDTAMLTDEADASNKHNGATNGDEDIDLDGESDEDFEIASDADSDGGEPSSDSEDDQEEGGGAEEEEDAKSSVAGEKDDAAEDSDDDEKAGAGQRMSHLRISKAAMDTAVKMVTQDLTADHMEEDELDDD